MRHKTKAQRDARDERWWRYDNPPRNYLYDADGEFICSLEQDPRRIAARIRSGAWYGSNPKTMITLEPQYRGGTRLKITTFEVSAASDHADV